MVQMVVTHVLSALGLAAGAAAMLLCGVPAALAQTNTGEIGGVLPGAIVTAEHADTGTRLERVTDAEGRYLLAPLRVGTYTITTEMPGFQRVVRSGVTLQLGQSLEIDFGLNIGAIAQEVTVTADAAAVTVTEPY